MLTLTRNCQTWTASFSNGLLFNEQGEGPSDIAALKDLVRNFKRHQSQTPVIVEMIASIERIIGKLFEGRPIPQLYCGGVNLAEF